MFLPLQRFLEREHARALLLLGIAVRVLTYFFLSPENNDSHAEVVRFIVDNGRLPSILETTEAQHPPLYYVLAAPLWAWSGSLKVVQLLSLACSIATLIVLYRLIYREGLLEGAQARLWSFCIACFLPQFVMFSLYVSNDTLTCLMGALAVWQTYRYICSPNTKQLVLLAALVGVGMLIKFIILAFIPVLFLLVLWVPRSRSAWRAAGRACAFLAIALTLGSYKFVDNYLSVSDAFANTMDDPRWDLSSQKQSYRGIGSYLDVNIVHLLESPTVSLATDGSYPLLLYGSFWYQHIPESNWRGNLNRRLRYLGPMIYLVALVPTAFFFAGLAALARGFPALIRRFDGNQPADQRLLTVYVAVVTLLTLLAMMVLAMNKYHVWSIMQARFLFPVLFGGLGAFSTGVATFSGSRLPAVILDSSMYLLVGLFGLYFASEIGLRLLQMNPAMKTLIESLIPG